MKKYLGLVICFCFVLGFFGSAHSIGISAPESIAADSAWSFSVGLDSTDSFEKAEVFVDNALAVTAYNDGFALKNSRMAIDAFTRDLDPNTNQGLTVYIMYYGLGEGEHFVTAKSYSGASLLGEATAKVFGENPSKKELEQGLEDINAGLGALGNTLNETKADLEKSVQEKQGNIDELSNSLGEEKNKTASLEEDLKLHREALLEIMAPPETGKEGIKNELNSVGLFGLKGSMFFGILFVVIAAIVLIFAFLNQRKKEGASLNLSFGLMKRQNLYDISENYEKIKPHEINIGKWGVAGKQNPKEATEPKEAKIKPSDLILRQRD